MKLRFDWSIMTCRERSVRVPEPLDPFTGGRPDIAEKASEENHPKTTFKKRTSFDLNPATSRKCGREVKLGRGCNGHPTLNEKPEGLAPKGGRRSGPGKTYMPCKHRFETERCSRTPKKSYRVYRLRATRGHASKVREGAAWGSVPDEACDS